MVDPRADPGGMGLPKRTSQAAVPKRPGSTLRTRRRVCSWQSHRTIRARRPPAGGVVPKTAKPDRRPTASTNTSLRHYRASGSLERDHDLKPRIPGSNPPPPRTSKPRHPRPPHLPRNRPDAQHQRSHRVTSRTARHQRNRHTHHRLGRRRNLHRNHQPRRPLPRRTAHPPLPQLRRLQHHRHRELDHQLRPRWNRRRHPTHHYRRPPQLSGTSPPSRRTTSPPNPKLNTNQVPEWL